METTNVVLDGDGRGEVQLTSDGSKAGVMNISVQDDLLTVFHTEVDPQYKDRGYAKLLLEQLVSYARKNNLRIIPLCSYVQVQFKRHPEDYKDIWYKNEE